MTLRLSILLFVGCATPALGVAIQPAPRPAPVVSDTRAEDARLIAFLDAAFDEATALSPESQTALGSQEQL